MASRSDVRVVALVGVSGVGKSSLLSRLTSECSFLHLQAGKLIKQEKEIAMRSEVSSEDLRLGCVTENQSLLVDGFRRATEGVNGLVVLDGHTVIDGSDGLVEVPSYVFASLKLQHLVFLQEEPRTILDRRAGDAVRRRPQRSVEELYSHQLAGLSAATKIALELNIPMTIITPSHSREFLVVLKDQV